jgi:hypothetical protein
MKPRPPREKRRPIVSGVFLVGLGLFLLLTSHDIIDPEQAWPLLIMVAGGAFIAAAITKREPSREQQSTPPRQ